MDLEPLHTALQERPTEIPTERRGGEPDPMPDVWGVERLAADPRAADGHFALIRPVRPLPDTGARMTTGRDGPEAFEHLHRYCIARDLCVGRAVLDVASGEGYGAAILAGVARQVCGLEIDAAAVAHARAAYMRPNLAFQRGDALALPFADGCFDVVVSFETLARLREQRRFLREVKRVLRPGGVFLLSTPDRQIYSAPGQKVNRHHVLELSEPEFSTMLADFFARHRIMHQRGILGSVVASGSGAWRSYNRRAADLLAATHGLAHAGHLIGIASDGALPNLADSIYGDDRSIDDMIAAAAVLPGLREALDQADRDARSAQAALDLARQHTAAERRRADELGRVLGETASRRDQLAGEVQALAAELAATRRALDVNQRVRAQVETALEAVRVSTWWRLGGPIRVLARGLGWRRGRPAPADGDGVAGLPAAIALPLPDLRAELGLPPRRQAVPQAAQIGLPDYAAPPVVSVLIPSYGQVDYTLRCLASIAAAPPVVPIEVIVVEDASGDPRVAELQAVRGLRLVRRAENLGFLRSCNQAAPLAGGAFLMLLNNDTEVMPGAIDALHRLLLERPDAGLVGARLLYPDGRLQEAGGIVWRDGSVWNYGRGDDPRKPEYSYVREADYISGAAIMLPRALWQQLGGFDEQYVPAYCEDSDLAFRVRAAGRQVLYQPQAQVIHHEGVSHGRDLATGLKACQVSNSRLLYERWRDVLRGAHLPNGARLMRARDRSLGRTVTLVIDHYVPQPDRDAGSRTMLAFMDALLAAGRVVKFFPVGGEPGSSYAAALQQRGIEVPDSPWRGSFATWIAANGPEIDEVLLSRPHIAEECLPALEAHCRAPIVFYGHDLHHARMRAELAARDDPRTRLAADDMEALERRVWRAVDVVLYPSEAEAEAVRALEPKVRALSVPAYALPPPPSPRTPPPAAAGLVFVAGFAHPPNVDAARWLVGEILPLLRAARPGLRLALVGSNPTPEVRALAAAGVEVTGFVPDRELARRYATARVAVCPLRFGAGVKLKVIEAMHHGVPLVTTPAGAQGLPGLERVCDVREDAAGFAAAVLALLDDDAAWRARTRAQSAFVAERFSAEAIRAGLERAFAVAGQRADA